jgi:hypothetical protein
MTDVRFTGVKMTDLACAAVAIYEGYVYKDDGSGQMTPCTAITDTAIAVAAYSSIDPQLGTAKTMTAGDSHAFYLLGSGAIVNVVSVGSITWQFGDVAYLSTTTGYVTNSQGSSAKKIGHYIGKDAVAATAGDFVQIVLDVPIGTT